MNLTLSLIRGRREVPVCFQMAKESGPRDHRVWVRVIRSGVKWLGVSVASVLLVRQPRSTLLTPLSGKTMKEKLPSKYIPDGEK